MSFEEGIVVLHTFHFRSQDQVDHVNLRPNFSKSKTNFNLIRMNGKAIIRYKVRWTFSLTHEYNSNIIQTGKIKNQFE